MGSGHELNENAVDYGRYQIHFEEHTFLHVILCCINQSLRLVVDLLDQLTT